jgi:tRNA-binding EMAP/Myf-like protein
MQGFVSNGMVLCAKNAEGLVEFISPPPDAKVGDRLVPEQFEGGLMPHSSAQIKKKKVWEEVAKDLATDSSCVATWNGIKLVVGGVECRSATLAAAPIS